MPLHLQPGCPCQCGADETYCNTCRFADGFIFSGSWLTRTTLGFSTVTCERSYPVSFPLVRYDTSESGPPATMGYLSPGPDTCIAVRGYVAYWGYGGELPAGLSCMKDYFLAPSSWMANISILILIGWRITRLSDTAIRPRSEWCALAYQSTLWFDAGQPSWPAVTPLPPPPSFYNVAGGAGGLAPLVGSVSSGWGTAFCTGVGSALYSYGFSARGLDLSTYAWNLSGALTPG